MKSLPIDASAPAPDSLEVSLFGPGYGECVVCHLGGGEWLVVDSCWDFRRNLHPAVEYLRSLNVDLGRDVVFVVASHWHDDHVRGLSDLLLECSAATFCCSSALRDSEFLEAVGHAATLQDGGQYSGLREMRRVFEIIKIRAGFNSVRWPLADRPLYLRSAGKVPTAKITSLSPSDAEYFEAMTSLVVSRRRADVVTEARKAHP
jgi:hypothetical protein